MIVENQNIRAYLMLATTAFCWGCNAVFAKMAVGHVSPLLLVTLRWVGVTILLLVFAREIINSNWDYLKPHVLKLFIMGTMGFTVFNALFYLAAYSTTALNIGIIQGSIPVFVLLGALLLFRTPISMLQMIGVALTVVGVCTVASGGSLQRLAALTITQGDWFMVIACLLYAGYALGLRQFSGISTLALFSMVAFSAALSSIPFTLIEYSQGNLLWPTAKGWVIAGLITLMPSFLAQVCFIKGVETIGPARAGVFVNLVPIFASFLAVAILNEPFQFFHAAALAFVLCGIGMAEKGKR